MVESVCGFGALRGCKGVKTYNIGGVAWSGTTAIVQIAPSGTSTVVDARRSVEGLRTAGWVVAGLLEGLLETVALKVVSSPFTARDSSPALTELVPATPS